jgi:UDP-sugar transporter A1/2/3
MKQRRAPDSNDSMTGTATEKNGSPPAGLSSFKMILLTMMVLQNSSTVLVGRYTRAGIPKEDQYQVNHLILIIELSKFVASCVLEFRTTDGKLWQSIQMHVLNKPMDALKITIPALLYLFQNTLLYVALENLTAPMFQVTYQFKLVTTAIMSVFMLSRKYSVQQWVCLVMISCGVAMVVLGETKPKEGADNSDAKYTNLGLGLIAVTFACMSSALAGVYFEKVLKKPATESDEDGVKTPPPSLWMRNMQLAFYTVIIAAVQGMLHSEEGPPKPYLHGFNSWTWALVILQAGGGLLVAAVIKYADNVLKGLATGVSVVLSSTLSMLLFGTPLSIQFLFGAVFILNAVWFFSNHLPQQLAKMFERKSEMAGLLPR